MKLTPRPLMRRQVVRLLGTGLLALCALPRRFRDLDSPTGRDAVVDAPARRPAAGLDDWTLLRRPMPGGAG